MLIYTEKGKIISIACYKECFYEGINLNGLQLYKVIELLKNSPTEHDFMELDDGTQDVFEFDNLGLQV
jgi:hypothetical protein